MSEPIKSDPWGQLIGLALCWFIAGIAIAGYIGGLVLAFVCLSGGYALRADLDPQTPPRISNHRGE